MSENKEQKPARTKQDVVSEHNNLAFRLGILDYEISEKESESKLVRETLRSLNFEYDKLDAAEKAAAAAQAAEANKGTTDAQPQS